jgi:DNA repair protein RecO (recombination protein O)
MTRSARRTELAPGYLLHHRPWRDTSRILEVLTREHGRLTLFARGVRGPQAKLAPVLQPFQPLLFSFSGRGEAATLTGAERDGSHAALPPAALLSGFYLNELLLKLTTRHDPQPELFAHYHATLSALRAGAELAPALRLFEKHLLEVLGYGLDLATEAHGERAIEPQGRYEFRPDAGLVAVPAGTEGALAGASLLGLAADDLSAPGALEDARRLLSAALGACLEGRTLATREVARAMVRKAAP